MSNISNILQSSTKGKKKEEGERRRKKTLQLLHIVLESVLKASNTQGYKKTRFKSCIQVSIY
jgi:hypothetical protein